MQSIMEGVIMRFKSVFISLLLFLCVSGFAFAQEKAQLQFKAKKGQAITYKVEGNFGVEVGGNKVNFEMKITQRTQITDVSPTGEITRESKAEEYEMIVNGQKMPVPDEALKEKDIEVIKPDGTIVSRKTEGAADGKEERRQSARLSQATDMVFAAKPIGVGDKWSYEFKEDDEKDSVAGVGEYEVVAFEKVKGVDTVKIKTTYGETAEERKLTCTGEVWVEKSSGDTVLATFKMDNLPFGPPGVSPSGTLRIERVAGSPLGDAPGGPTTAAAPKKDKTIEEVVKDYEKLEGVFTLYRKKEAGRETVYMEVREDQLDKLLLLQATASTGVGSFLLAAGDPLADIVFKFVKREEQVLFVVPNLAFGVDKQKPIARSVKRSFADAYLDSYKVEAKDEKRKSVLINVTDLFRSDIAQITQVASMATGGQCSIDKEKTIFNTIKVFPTNLLIQTAYHLSRSAGGAGNILSILGLTLGNAPLADPRSVPLTVNYNLFFLPQNNYRPRLSDPRVGYFVAQHQDLTEDKEEQMKRFILRWHVEKQDPNAPLSPPKEPIVFWLDNAIPEEYREAVKKGILLWNKAFEKVGIKDAIVVKQMPDNADWDHADMRYNVIRWVSSEANGYAVALFRVNPLTGQILNASITVDANITRFGKIEFQRMVDPLTGLRESSADILSASFAGWKPALRCNYAQEALPQAWLGLTAMNFLAGAKGTKVSEKEYVEDFVTSIIAHEMGHIMGLRHNFIASTLNDMKQLANGERVRNVGVVSSVMDYIPFNEAALHAPNTDYWTTTIGPYDIWAIEYGYTPVEASSPEAEKEKLKAIACKVNQPGHAYMSDEVADSFDPLITRFDLGKDPLEYWASTFKDVRALLNQLPTQIPKKGENYWQFTRYFNGLLSMYAQAASITSRYVGGLHLRGNHRGDPGEKYPLVPVSAADQQRALNLLRDNIFAKDAFNFPKNVFLKLAPNPYPDLAQAVMGNVRQDAPIRDTISAIQRMVLSQLFNAQILNRIANNEFKASNGTVTTLTLPTLFRTVTDAVWEESRNGSAVDSLRRQLQRAHLKTLTDMITQTSSAAPDDAKMLARYHLRQLKNALHAAQKKVKDPYTQIHYAEAIEQINKALDAKVTIGSPTPAVRTLPFPLGQ
jgi:hypothetical protein